VNTVVTDHLEPQLALEEGNRNVIYDDATGKPFVKGDTLQGNLSVGIGINLMVPFDADELAFIEKNRLGKATAQLARFQWFTAQDPVRQTALADVAYNIGVTGLLHWPHFLSFMAEKDYLSAVKEIRGNTLWVSQVKSARANRIEQMILTGLWPVDVKVAGSNA